MQNMNGKVRNVRLCWDFVHYCLEGPVAYEDILIYATQELQFLGMGGTGSCGEELVGETSYVLHILFAFV